MVGITYRDECKAFEKWKTLDITNYIKDPRNDACMKGLTTRMKEFVNLSLEIKLGLLPFSFEKDFNGAMT